MKRIFFLILCFILNSCGVQNNTKYFIKDDTYIFNVKVDNFATTNEREQISNAADSWNHASGGKVKINLLWNKMMPNDIKRELLNPSVSGNNLWLLTKDDRVYFSDSELLEGLYFPINGTSFIFIFADAFPRYHFYDVSVHEFGHLLGLNHSEDIMSTMHTHTTSGCITIEDAKALCEIYNCTPHAFCLFNSVGYSAFR